MAISSSSLRRKRRWRHDGSQQTGTTGVTTVPNGSRVTIALLSAPDSVVLGHLKAWRGRVVAVDQVAIKIDVDAVRSQLGWQERWDFVTIPWARIDHLSFEIGASS